jgi:hypothetical protein
MQNPDNQGWQRAVENRMSSGGVGEGGGDGGENRLRACEPSHTLRRRRLTGFRAVVGVTIAMWRVDLRR